MHRVFDVLRAQARALGSALAEEGSVPDADAVFYLTLDELLGPLPADVAELVAFRRERRALYRSLEVPAQFSGVPEPILVPVSDAAGPGPGTDSTLRGLAVAAGSLEGTARVVLDATGDVEVRDGEILVCHTTDPSWISLMVVAGGLVTDIGSALSHAAIVARELGIPCVVGADGASATIRTGDLLRLDGDAGSVTILRRAL
jgi:pyruvate,water dikinase